jgi:hypothetical protein
MLAWTESQANGDGPRCVYWEYGIDLPDEQWERLRRALPCTAARTNFRVATIIAAYEEATGTCIGCD